MRRSDRVDLHVGGVGGDVAFAVRRVDADRQALGGALAALEVAGDDEVVGNRGAAAGVAQDGLDAVRVLLAVLVDRVLGVDLHAFEVMLHDEVDDAGHGVSAVNGRGAAGQDVDALNQRGGDEVQVSGDR